MDPPARDDLAHVDGAVFHHAVRQVHIPEFKKEKPRDGKTAVENVLFCFLAARQLQSIHEVEPAPAERRNGTEHKVFRRIPPLSEPV